MCIWGISFVLYWIGLWTAQVVPYFVFFAAEVGMMCFCMTSGVCMHYLFNMALTKMTLTVHLVGMIVLLAIHIGSSISFYFIAFPAIQEYSVMPLQANIIVAFILIILIGSAVRRLIRFTDEVETKDKVKAKYLLFSFTMFFIVTGILLQSFGYILRFESLPDAWRILGSITGSLFLYFGLGLSFNSLISIHTDDTRYPKFLKIEIFSFLFAIIMHLVMLVIVTIAHIVFAGDKSLLQMAYYAIYLPINILFTILFGIMLVYVGIMTWVTLQTAAPVESPPGEDFEKLQEENE